MEGDPRSIFYVGRTKNYDKRMRSHEKTKGNFVSYIVLECKDVVASRAVEQAVLSACIVCKIFTMDKGVLLNGTIVPTGSNRIRGIAEGLVSGFKNDLTDLLSLMTCTTESDLLNLMRS